MLKEQDMIAYAMDNPFFVKAMNAYDPEDLFWMHPGNPEAMFEVYMLVRRKLLKDPQGLHLHEVLVGGSKRQTDGKKKPVKFTLSKSEIISVADQDLWSLFMVSGGKGIAKPNQDGNWMCGSSVAPLYNIMDIDLNSVEIVLACWMPDFEYLDFLTSQGVEKYDEEAYALAEPYLSR